jgi:hypothetical protein
MHLSIYKKNVKLIMASILPWTSQKLKFIWHEIKNLITSRGSTGCLISIWTIFESGCGIQMSQPTPTKCSMLFKYRTRAIITRGLYTFSTLFEVHLCTVTFGLMYG